MEYYNCLFLFCLTTAIIEKGFAALDKKGENVSFVIEVCVNCAFTYVIGHMNISLLLIHYFLFIIILEIRPIEWGLSKNEDD